jgi:hypothetical protein
MRKFLQYLFNWAHLFDQSINTLFGGDPRMTLSARMGHDILEGKCKFCGYVCQFLNLFEARHCEKAWEDELLAPNPVDQIVNE